MTTHTRRSLAIIAAAATGVMLTACASDDNRRLTIGDDVTLRSLPPTVPEPILDDRGEPVARPAPADDQPSLAGLDRSNFEPIVFAVPIDGSRHQPEVTEPFRLTDETPRHRGEFPTATSALIEPSSSGWTTAGEVLIAPLWAFGDAALLPGKLVIDPVFETVGSPDERTGRTPEFDHERPTGIRFVTDPVPAGQTPASDPDATNDG